MKSKSTMRREAVMKTGKLDLDLVINMKNFKKFTGGLPKNFGKMKETKEVEDFGKKFEAIKKTEWKPEHRELYYVITADGQIFEIHNHQSFCDRRCFSLGNCFRTKKAAKHALKEVKRLLKSLPRG